MLRIIASTIVGILLSIVVNLVSNYVTPNANQRKKMIYSALFGLIVLTILIAVIPDTAEQSIVSFANAKIFSSPWAWLYITVIVVSLFFASRFILKKLHIFITVSSPNDQEKAYLESLIKDLEHYNQLNRWSDKYYVDIDAELRERVADYNVPPQFYLVKPIDRERRQQDFNNLTNVEKIDSSRGTSYKTLETALGRAMDNAVVVIAPPGGGKTVSLRNLAIKLAKCRLKGEIPQLPIFINLGYYTGTDQEGKPQAFEEFIEQYFVDAGYKMFLANRHWKELLQTSQCTFFLDGLDELPRGKNEYVIRARLIEDFTRDWPNTKFVVSCRELDYERDLSFQQILIKPFDRKHIQKFISKYFSMANALSFVQELEENQPIFELCKNPFYLNLICYYVEVTKRLPQNKTQLFKLIVDRLIERETTRMSRDETETFRQSFTDSIIYLASVLAFHRMSTTITLDEYKAELQQYPDKEKALEMLNFAIRGEIIEKNEANTIRFTHNRFQEYFSSFEVVRNYRSPEYHFPREFFANIWWRETILFVAGLDTHPSDFVRLVLKARQEYTYPQPLIERMIKLDMSIMAFDCIFSCLDFNDSQLFFDVRDYLIEYYQNANILEKAKILTALSQDQSESSRHLIEGALNDKSDWVSERAFFIINEGALRLQMKPMRILAEFWRFFINGRIFSTVPSVVKASGRSKLLRLLLPVYFLLLLANLFCVSIVLFVGYKFFNFLAFDLKYTFTAECLGCLASIGTATAIILYYLTRDQYTWLKRFLFTAPLALMLLYLVFNVTNNLLYKTSGILLGILLAYLLERYLKRYAITTLFLMITFIIIGLTITSMIAKNIEGTTFGDQVNYTLFRLNITIPTFQTLVPGFIIPIGLLIALFLLIVFMLGRQLRSLRLLSKYRNSLKDTLKGSIEDEKEYEALERMFTDLKSFNWAQKRLLQDVILHITKHLKKTREDCILYLLKLAEHLKMSPIQDAVYQKIEDEERSYRREI